MDSPPETPEKLFLDYLPQRFARARLPASLPDSIGSLTFRVIDDGEFTLRLVGGELEVSRGMQDDVLLQLTLPEDSLVPLVVDSIRRAEDRLERVGLGAVRALSLDAETARGLRHLPGSVLFLVRDETPRRLLFTPGRREADMDGADCTVEIDMEDFIDVQTGEQQAAQLFFAGKLKITGNVQLAVALSGIFS